MRREFSWFISVIAAVIIAISMPMQAVAVSAWQTVGTQGFSAGAAIFTSLVFNDSTPYVAFKDGGNDSKATVMKFDGTNWVNVGAAGFSSGQANYVSLAFDGLTPYVAYKDLSTNKVNVMKFDGTNWVVVGNANFATGIVDYVSLAFVGDTPYVAYKDSGTSGKINVKKFDGTSWVSVGAAGFSVGAANFASMAVYNNTPYVAFMDNGNGGKATVMKFDGTDWVNVGNAGFSASFANNTSLAFGGATPYVAYRDGDNAKATVMKFDGTSWVTVGNAQFSAASANYTSIAVDGSTPYVAYQDSSNGFQTTVMKFNGTNWVAVGGAGISGAEADYTSLALDGSTPYVTYFDTSVSGFKATVKKFIWDNATSFANAEDGQSISLTTPDGAANVTCSSTSKESTTDADSEYAYPLGLVNFCFDTTQTDNQISLTFVTDLLASQVVARKYDPVAKTYADIPGATITETTVGGQHALLVSYTVTDNGPLDQDPAAGSIIDPVGLAVQTGSPASGGATTSSTSDPQARLADTGENILMPGVLAATLITSSIASLWVNRRKTV